MKRAGRLFDAILDRDNLRVAFHSACRGKRDRMETRRFADGLETNLAEMADQLRSGSFTFGRFSQFVIHDPKERVITAPCFPERVAHHAILAVCGPVLDRWLLSDTFACRVGKGRIAAVDRAAAFASRFPFFLKLDIRKYFDSIPHRTLLARLARRFKDRRVLDLFDRIVRSFRGGTGLGLPIGSLTSQHFANFYLGWFDREVKERWQVPGYVRYMDDMALWSMDRDELSRVEDLASRWLSDELGLEVKPFPYRNRTIAGMDFLGCRVFSDHVTLNRRGRTRFRRKLAALQGLFEMGGISERELQSRATALIAFTRTAGVSAWQTRRALIDRLGEPVTRLEPGDPGRELEQQRQELPVGEPEQELA
jgi:RNA-directed DNA polymerase